MTDGGESANGVTYPPLAANNAKNWEPALLNACSSKRLLAIAAEFDLSGYSRLPKLELYQFIYNQMLTEQECTVCRGQCVPAEHLFQPHEAVPNTVSQSGVPPAIRSPQSGGGRSSPNSRVRQQDSSPDTPLGNGGGFQPLFPGQVDSTAQSSQQLSVVENIQIGARVNDESFLEPADMDADDSFNLDDLDSDHDVTATLRAEAVKFQAQLDEIEKRDDERRRARLEKAKQAAAKAGPTIAQQIEAQKKAQREAMKKRKEAKDAAARAELQKLKSAPRPPPARRSSAPPNDSGTRFNFEEIDDALSRTGRGTHIRDVEDVFEEEEPLTKKNLVECMSISVVKAIEAMEASKKRSMSLGAADPSNFNGVPDGAPNTGKLALKSVSNRFMADRFGLAPTPNLSIEGDLTSLDTQKLHKHMTSGANRKPGQFVQRQMTWPEQCLSAQAPGKDKSTFKNLSFPELVDGFIGKALMETDHEKLDMELANKLSFLREMATMSYSLDHQSVLTISHRFLQGWENCSWEWSNWSRIEGFLREARYQELCSSISKAGNNRKQSNGGQGGGAHPPGNSDVLGIPTKFYTENTLCIRFNKGECKEKTSHKHKTQDYTLLHKCAGCLKAGVEEVGHGVSNIKCPNKPKAPFRQ